MTRFTILADRRSTVMVAALVVCAALPLLALPLADPYQPIRALAAACSAGLVVVVSRPVHGRVLKIAAWVLAGLAVCLASSSLVAGSVASVYGVHGRFQGLTSAGVLVATGVAGAYVSGKSIRAFAWSLAALGAALGAVVTVQALTGVPPVAAFGNQVIAAAWLAVSLCVTAAAAALATGPQRTWLSAAAVPVAIGLGACGSRGAWIGAAAGLALMTWMLRDRLRLRGAAVVAIAISVVIGTGIVLGGTGSLAKLDPSAISSGSARSRLEIWKGTARLIAAHPALGVGPGRYLYEFPLYQPFAHAVTEPGDTRPDQAHSWPLHLAAEAGLPAAALALALFGVALLNGVKAAGRKDGAALIASAGLAAYAGQSLFAVAAVEVDVLGAILAGFLIARSAEAPRETGSRILGPRHLAALLSAALVAACVVYIRADASHTRGLTQFNAGDMASAFASSGEAVRGNAASDVYRVALADAALYTGDPGERVSVCTEALSVVEQGLSLEPASYDLLLARSRLLAATGATPNEVADSYAEAVARYPLGIEVRRAGAQALRDAGREQEADRMLTAVESLLAAQAEAVR